MENAYVVTLLLLPTDKEREEGKKAENIGGLRVLVAKDVETLKRLAILELSSDLKDVADRVEVRYIPFLA